MHIPDKLLNEWLETDGLGGFASATVGGVRTRRYHGLLTVATTPPTGRMMLVNGIEAWVETESSFISLSTQAYAPDVIHPDGYSRIDSFSCDLWPCWRYRLAEGAVLEHKIFAVHHVPLTVLTWRLVRPVKVPLTLHVRPLMSGRDIHYTHYKNSSFNFEPEEDRGMLVFNPYPSVPGTRILSNGGYTHHPQWYERFLYEAERERGYDHTEDLASPGVFSWDLTAGEASLILSEASVDAKKLTSARSPERAAAILEEREEARRRKFHNSLARAGDAYVVKRAEGKSIIAGYPWFTDWGRDTFISLRGLCIAGGRLDDARDVLTTWAEHLSEGMIPNVFPDSKGSAPMFNAVDASLWFIVGVHEYFEALRKAKKRAAAAARKTLESAVQEILSAYTRGTRYGIKCAKDGLLNAGSEGVQLTWMDAKVDGHVVTPRSGKPVEVQALWLNALHIGAALAPKWEQAYRKGLSVFSDRFWNSERGYLYDVVDCNGKEGVNDPALRPNQIFAVGGLPIAVLSGEQAAKIVSVVEKELYTPRGLRSLAPSHPSYRGRYEGDVKQRDFAYHQGTVWPWLMGAFVEGWVRVNGGDAQARRSAYERFMTPMLQDLASGGIGHVSEIADAEAPHTLRGCPFQAWSVGEVIRLLNGVLAVQDDSSVAKNGDAARSADVKRVAQATR